MIEKILIVRYIKPIQSLINNWSIKLPASILTSLWALIVDIFSTNAELVGLLIFAMIGDWFLGVMASKAKKVKISSIGLRQLFVKSIEYFIFLGIVIGISNVFGNSDEVAGAFSYLQYVHYPAFFYAIITELTSIGENSKYAGKIFKEIINKFKKE